MTLASDYYVKLNFSKEQLAAIETLYYRYYEPKMPTYAQYKGTGAVAVWREGMLYDSGRTKEEGLTNRNFGFEVYEADKDPLWDLFDNLREYMGKTAVITKMPPLANMSVHIDREWRAIPIYFPILGCTDSCVSTCYTTDKSNMITSGEGHPVGVIDPTLLVPLHSFSIHENAYLMDVSKLHGVKNKQLKPRIAFGWNFGTPDLKFNDCKKILTDLGYLL